MTRNGLVTTALLTIGVTAAAVLAADMPMPSLGSEPAPATQQEQPPDHIIRVEIGFDPNPLEEPPPRIIAPEPTIVPVPVVPAGATPPMPPVANIDGPKSPALSLAALERMVSGKTETQKTPPPGSQRLALKTVSATVLATGESTRPIQFVDQVVSAGGQSPSPVQSLTQQYRLLNAVRLHYYHLLALQRLISVREELAGISRDAVTAIEGMIATGQATKAELLQAKVEAREQAAALQSAKSIHNTVWHRMAALVGQPNLPVGPLAGDLEQCCLTPGFDAAWAHLLEANPELLAARTEVARRQAGLRQNLSGTGKAEKSGDGMFTQAMASIVNGPFQSRDPQVKQVAWAELSRSEGEVTRVEQSLRFRLADAYGRCERAKEVVDLYRTQNLPDAKEAFELSVMSYRQGRGSWPQVQIAQRNYFRISTEYVEALADLRRTELSILGLVMDVPEDPQATVKQAMHQSK
ncbi:MAG TPA: TolC family protein [Gemmataceae bacterium]|nr:TolC family protein [Gemmataceae bacterium]